MRKFVLHDSFWELYDQLTPQTQAKVDMILNILETQRQPSEKHVKHLVDSGGIYEIRVQDSTRLYRFLFFFVDGGNMLTGKQFLVCEGFIKKDNKDYKKPIQRVQAIKDTYNDSNTVNTNNGDIKEVSNDKDQEEPP